MKKALIALLAFGFVCSFALPALAADPAEWSFYGRAQMETRWDNNDSSEFALDPFVDRDTLSWGASDSGSAVGGRVDAGNIGGRFELRYDNDPRPFNAGSSAHDEDLTMAYMYGTWRYSDNGFLLLGHTSTPSQTFISGQALQDGTSMIGYGTFYTGRKDQVKVEHNWGALHFEIAGIQPEVATNSGNDLQTHAGALLGGGNDDAFLNYWNNLSAANRALWTRVSVLPRYAGEDDGAAAVGTYSLPKIEARLRYNFGLLTASVWGGWQETEMSINIADGGNNAQEVEADVEAWQVGTAMQFAMGPFYASGQVYFGENPAQYGLFDSAPSPYWDQGDSAVDGVGQLYDVDNWAWQIVAGFKVNDMLSFEAGYGETEAELDGTYTDIAGTGDTNPFSMESERSSWYVQATISPVQGFRIIPEIVHRDFGDLSTSIADASHTGDRGDSTYYGVMWALSW